jgi:hypothetical protein
MSSSSSNVPSSSSSSLSADGISIRLTRQTSDYRADGYGHRLVVTADQGNGVPNEIFQYQTVPAEAIPAANPSGEFIGVTRAYGLAMYPGAMPTVGPFPAFYRLDVVDIIFPDYLSLESTWSTILEETQILLNTVKALQTLGDPVQVTLQGV